MCYSYGRIELRWISIFSFLRVSSFNNANKKILENIYSFSLCHWERRIAKRTLGGKCYFLTILTGVWSRFNNQIASFQNDKSGWCAKMRSLWYICFQYEDGTYGANPCELGIPICFLCDCMSKQFSHDLSLLNLL